MHRSRLPILVVLLGLAPFLARGAAVPSSAAVQSVATERPRARCAHEVVPAELFEIERVVDGDTVWVRRKGEVEKLRLLSVDTEERLGKGHASSATKPQTVFGEETALWAADLIAKLAKDGAKPRVGVLFPDGKEQRDVFGRLLCHLLLPDGTDYNLLLVEQGWSPYFTKYGHDTVCHAAFVSAQAAARKAKLGIWNPKTNVPATSGAPAAIRPYDQLLPWWDARGAAVEGFRKAKAEHPDTCFHAEDSAGLAQAAKAGAEVEVFGEVGKSFAEKNGDLTVLLRGANADKDVRVRIPAARREAHAVLDFEALAAEFRQNYVFVRGKLVGTGRGFELVAEGPERWRKAGPEPAPERVPVPAGGSSGK